MSPPGGTNSSIMNEPDSKSAPGPAKDNRGDTMPSTPARSPAVPVPAAAVGREAANPFLAHLQSLRELQITLSQEGRAEAILSDRSEEHTSELQSLAYLVCRLLLEKKKTTTRRHTGSSDTSTAIGTAIAAHIAVERAAVGSSLPSSRAASYRVSAIVTHKPQPPQLR